MLVKSKAIKSILIPILGILSTTAIAPIVMSSCGEQASKQSDEQGSERGNEQTLIPVESIKLDNSELVLTIGQKQQLTATISPEDATNKNVTWTSSNENIAIVGENGTVEAVGEGEATITATTEDGRHTATCVVAVVMQVIGISLNEYRLDLQITKTQQLTATILPSDVTNKKVTWISNDPNVATVDENGTVKAVGVGHALITAETDDGGKTYQAFCVVYVKT